MTPPTLHHMNDNVNATQSVQTRAASRRVDSRLILAFDASCGTCREIARRTADICGDQFSVLSLSHPRVVELRHETLGADAPWVPTLLDPDASPSRVWIGKSLTIKLATLVGPRKSWKVLKAIGAIRQEGRIVDLGRSGPKFSRARFLSGIPLAIGGASLLLASPSQAATTQSALRITATPSHSLNTRQLTNTTLSDNAISTLASPDIKNVLSEDLLTQLRSCTRVTEATYQQDLGLLRYNDSGSTKISEESTVDGMCTLVRSTEHAIGTNKALVTAYVFPQEGYVLAHEKFEQEFDGVRSRARLWTIPDFADGEFTSAGLSINGSTVQFFDATSTSTSAQQIECGGCTLGGDWSVEKTIGTECGGGAFYDCAKALAPCAACLTQCGTFGPVCFGCLVSLCPFAYIDCCGGRVPTCYSCDVG